LTYMGMKFMFKGTRPCYMPLRDKCMAIRNMIEPASVTQCKSFCGMVNFLSSFIPQLRKDLIPIYDAQKRDIPFEWSRECQDAFENIKNKLVQPPVLHMPIPGALFRLESDTSTEAVGGALYQWQQDKWVLFLLGYNSKRLPAAVKNYGITELELCGLVVNLHSFRQLLNDVHFEVLVDHKAIENIKNSKKEPPTKRIQRLLQHMAGYSFDLKYKPGKDMLVSDALSRLKITDPQSTLDVIPLSFLAHTLMCQDEIPQYQFLAAKLYNPPLKVKSKTSVKSTKGSQPQSASKSKKVVKIAKTDKKIPIRQGSATKLTAKDNKTLKLMAKATQIASSSVESQQQVDKLSGKYSKEDTISLVNPELQLTQSVQAKLDDTRSAKTTQYLTTYRQPDKNMALVPISLFKTNAELSIMRKHIPQQKELDSLIKQIDLKVLHKYKLPVNTVEFIQQYRKSSEFKDIYNYITKDFLPHLRNEQRIVRNKAKDYIVVNEVLLRIVQDKQLGIKFQIAIPEKYEPIVFNNYHNMLLAGHQGVGKTSLTIAKYYFIPNIHTKLNHYLEACVECQKCRSKSTKNRPFHPRIPHDYTPMQHVSADIKYMPNGFDDYKFMLVCTCELTNFVIAVPLKRIDAPSVAEALIHRLICVFGPPKRLIVDKDKALSGKIVQYILDALKCNLKIISPWNHGSLKTERSIQTIGNMITKHLKDKGQNWPLYAATAAYAMNTFASDALAGYSPFELVFVRKPPDLLAVSFPAIKQVPLQYREYVQGLVEKSKFAANIYIEYRAVQANERVQKAVKYKDTEQFFVGDLVYLLAPHASALQTGTTKFRQDFVGPLVVDSVVDSTHYILKDMHDRPIPDIYHINRIKPYYKDTDEGNVSEQQKLRDVVALKAAAPQLKEIAN
jgi:hypothetical protein